MSAFPLDCWVLFSFSRGTIVGLSPSSHNMTICSLWCARNCEHTLLTKTPISTLACEIEGQNGLQGNAFRAAFALSLLQRRVTCKKCRRLPHKAEVDNEGHRSRMPRYGFRLGHAACVTRCVPAFGGMRWMRGKHCVDCVALKVVFTLGDARSFFGLTSKMLNFDAAVKKMAARH